MHLDLGGSRRDELELCAARWRAGAGLRDRHVCEPLIRARRADLPYDAAHRNMRSARGSRGRHAMKHHALAAVTIALAGCTVGAPPGFSGGDRWTFPLVGPLEDGLLVTPVSVHG